MIDKHTEEKWMCRGVPIEELTREQLLELVGELCSIINRRDKEHLRTIDILCGATQ